MRIAERREMPPELRALRRRNLHAREYAAVVRAVIAVVEETDVPAMADRFEEREQRARPLGEFEAEEPLVVQSRHLAADHVAHVQLRELVAAQVVDRIAA